MKDTLLGKPAPGTTQVCPVSARLAEKLAVQVEWMEERGINIRLKDSEKPRPAPRKPPRPGTVVEFSVKH